MAYGRESDAMGEGKPVPVVALFTNSFLYFSPLDYRPIYVQTGVLATTDGSARVQIDTTTVLVGVKAEMTAVEDSSQCVNRLRFFVDFSAIASPMFAGTHIHL